MSFYKILQELQSSNNFTVNENLSAPKLTNIHVSVSHENIESLNKLVFIFNFPKKSSEYLQSAMIELTNGNVYESGISYKNYIVRNNSNNNVFFRTNGSNHYLEEIKEITLLIRSNKDWGDYNVISIPFNVSQRPIRVGVYDNSNSYSTDYRSSINRGTQFSKLSVKDGKYCLEPYEEAAKKGKNLIQGSTIKYWITSEIENTDNILSIDPYFIYELLINPSMGDSNSRAVRHYITSLTSIDEVIKKAKNCQSYKDEKFTFGKYYGKTIEEVYNIDEGYLKWLINQDSSSLKVEIMIHYIKAYLFTDPSHNSVSSIKIETKTFEIGQQVHVRGKISNTKTSKGMYGEFKIYTILDDSGCYFKRSGKIPIDELGRTDFYAIVTKSSGNVTELGSASKHPKKGIPVINEMRNFKNSSRRLHIISESQLSFIISDVVQKLLY